MKRATIIIMMALGILLSWACSRIEEAPLTDGLHSGMELTVKATLADAAMTRTVLNGKSIYWTKDDAINLFYGDRSSGKFVSSVGDEPVLTTDFVGTLTVATGSSEAGMSARAFWGVYPYDENNTCDGSGVTMTLPSQQEALAGSFADKLNPSVATSAGLDLSFYNVGAPFYFSVTQEGVTSATFKGNNDEDVAGKVHVTMDSDRKPVAEVLEGVKSITITAPDGGFVPGETYVIVLLPQVQMTGGYTVTFRKGDLEADCVVSKSVPFERSKGRSKMNADEGLIYAQPDNEIWYYTTNNQKITWLPSALSSKLVSNVYEGGKGILTFDGPITEIPDETFWIPDGEPDFGNLKQITKIILPPSVTSIGGSFANIDSLEEVVLPEGLVTIGPSLNSLPNLKRLSIPSSLTTINEYCLNNCPSLVNISVNENNTRYDSRNNCNAIIETQTNTLAFGCVGTVIPSAVVSIGGNAFERRSGLVTISLPESVTAIGNSAFSQCDDLNTMNLGSIVSVGSYAFSYCHNLADILFGEGLLSIDNGAFMYSGLSSVVLPASIQTIGGSAFEGCNLASITCWATTPPALSFSGTQYGDMDPFRSTNNCPIYVPAASVEAYRISWAVYADRIHAIPLPVPEAVDLGLPSGLKWASFNLGATTPEEFGEYYAWGEIEPYYSSLNPLTWKEGKEEGYWWSSYMWCMGSGNTMTKYCDNTSSGYNGFTDNKTVLDLEDDAASANLGGTWRMPTDAEWTELKDNCTWTWVTQNGVNGRLVTANNGNSIFLPATGLRSGIRLDWAGSNGGYWTSSLITDYPGIAYYVDFDSGWVPKKCSSQRCHGYSIRPVSE